MDGTPIKPTEPVYDRAALVDVLVHHWRMDIRGCGCGWAELGRSFAEHVANVYEERAADRVPCEGPGRL